MPLIITQENGVWQMDKQEIERIRSMVAFGLYRVCLVNGYNSAMFGKFKEEQNRLFDNYISNRSLIEEAEQENEADKEIENLWMEFQTVPMMLGEDHREYLAEEWNDFSKETWVNDILFWFDYNHSKGIRYLENKFGSKYRY